ncbi:MAG: M23 family metallopeptidase [Synergistaceae bacterium]|jgi:murein DD-endopeptidase MepM/ murein hydrolase activator NlpD|nr:M23 family metallopeptidase [Synergistaceae bacterium]
MPRKYNHFLFFCLAWALAMKAIPLPAAKAAVPVWESLTWTGDVAQMQDLEKMCREYGVLSSDVFWVNDYTPQTPPRKGDVVLIPHSKSALIPTWTEVQSRKNRSSDSLVTVKLHGIPLDQREKKVSPDLSPVPPSPASPSKNFSSAPPTPPTSATPLIPSTPSTPPASSVSTAAGASSPPEPSPSSGAPADSDSKKSRFEFPPEAPLVTIKLHGVPSFMKDLESESSDRRPVSPELKTTVPVTVRQTPSPEVKEPVKNMQLVISGDRVAVVSSDISVRPEPAPASTSPALTLPPPSLKEPPPLPAVPSPTSGKMIWPVNGAVSSGFGKRGKRRFHAGLDLPMPKGTPIAAALDGVVRVTIPPSTPQFSGYGNLVLLDHGNGLATLYAHCDRINVKKGQRVRQGDIVAYVGSSGRSTTFHVHFEVRKNGRPVNPVPLLPARDKT